jgi:hypothetical protein
MGCPESARGRHSAAGIEIEQIASHRTRPQAPGPTGARERRIQVEHSLATRRAGTARRRIIRMDSPLRAKVPGRPGCARAQWPPWRRFSLHSVASGPPDDRLPRRP